MSAFDQSSGVAQELADEQREISIAEFFEKNKQMLGFGSKTRALVTAVKEGVDNSLDAAEDADILPDIRVEITENDQYYTLIIEDNGPGIPKSSVPNVFGKLLYGSRFHSRAQSRGQQGIGISAAVLYSQLTSGNPARITSKPMESDDAYYVELGIDTDTNDPQIHTEETIEWEEKEHGTRVELDMEGNMRARKRLHEYIRQTAVVNPHATVELYEPEHELIYDERPVDELPDDVEEIKPHPHGVELGTLMDMLEKSECIKLNAFFKNEFTRVGQKTADDILNNFRDSHYGRGLAWPLFTDRTPEEDYKDAFCDSVRGKGHEATETFYDYTFEKLEEYDVVTYENIEDAVAYGAEEAGKETFKQFAETVQENAVESVWNVITENVLSYTIERVDAVTIDRKNTELVARVGRELANQMESSGPTRMTKSELETAVKNSADKAVETMNNGVSFGETAQEKVVDDFWERARTVSDKLPLVREVAGDRDKSKHLLTGMQRANAMAPPTKCLSPITEEDIVEGLKTGYDAEFYTSTTRSAQVVRGQPFIIETGIAYGGNIDNGKKKIQLNRFANRVPLVYQQGACAITQVVKNIRWNSYYTSRDKISQNKGSLPQGPMVLMVHIASTNVPFTSESKDAVASMPEVEEEVERAIRDVARDLKDYMKEQRTRRKRQQKRDVIGGLLQDMTNKLEKITEEDIDGKEESQARILNNVYVEKTESDAFTVTNYSGLNEDVRVTGEVGDVPGDSSSDVTIEDDGSFGFTVSISPNETVTVDLGAEVTDFEVKEPEGPKITTAPNK